MGLLNLSRQVMATDRRLAKLCLRLLGKARR